MTKCTQIAQITARMILSCRRDLKQYESYLDDHLELAEKTKRAIHLTEDQISELETDYKLLTGEDYSD